MRKTIIRLLKLLAVFCFASAVSIIFFYSNDSQGIKADAASKVDLNYLMKKYPDGKYWNHVGMSRNNADGWTDKPCRHYLVGGWYKPAGTCNSFYGIQCWGFVNKLANECYGTNNYSQWPRTTLSKLKPGDAIRFKNNSHSIFVTGVQGDIVTYGECNSEYSNCKIRWNVRTTKTQIAKSLTGVYSAPSELTVNLTNNTELKTTTVMYGKKLEVQGNASGGESGYQYQFSIMKPGSKSYEVIQEFGISDKLSYIPTPSGSHKLKVIVRDRKGKTDDKILGFSVLTYRFINKSTIEKNRVKYGDQIKINLAATGGSFGYNFRIMAIKPSAASPVILRNYCPYSTYYYKPWETGTYRIFIDATDREGRSQTVEYDFTVTADKLVNTSVMADNVKTGDTAVLMLSSKGGTGQYRYCIEVKHPWRKEYITLRSSYSIDTFNFHPTKDGVYYFKVTVTDRLGNTAQKKFKLTADSAVKNTIQYETNRTADTGLKA